MITHPAFSSSSDDSQVIIGLIKSLLHTTDSSAIVSLVGGSERIKAIMPYRSIQVVPQIGEVWSLTGEYEYHDDYGEQFITSFGHRTLPRGTLIVAYFQHHIPGIGINKAKALWSVFGNEIYRVLNDSDISALTDKKRGNLPFDIAHFAIEKWQINKSETEAARFFHQKGFSTSLAKKALSFYGTETLDKIVDNPYRLLAFTSFDAIDKPSIECFGVELNDQRRMLAGVTASVYKAYDSGHMAIPTRELLKNVKQITHLSTEDSHTAISLALEAKIIVENYKDKYQGLGQFQMESFVARKLVQLLGNFGKGNRPLITPDLNPTLLAEFEKTNELYLNKAQKQAIALAFTKRLVLICGGAGVGKTTFLLALHHQMNNSPRVIAQVALSGRTAKKLADATQSEASTIDAFLTKVRKKPLADGTKLIIYEASTIDVPTMISLLRVLPSEGSLVLIGDSYQLPPTGSGLVFQALCDIPDIPKVHLSEIHCPASSTGIPFVLGDIRGEKLPAIYSFDKSLSLDKQVGLCHIDSNEKNISSIAVGLSYFVAEWGETQIIAPTVALCDDINIQLHNSYKYTESDQIKPLVRCKKSIALDDVIVCTKNIHSKNLTNGSLGRITYVYDHPETVILANGDTEISFAVAEFGGEEVKLSANDFQDIKLGYAITCNRLNGGEFDRVIIAMPESRVLDNTWIYTSISRANKQAVVIGNINILKALCISKPKELNRCIALPKLIEDAQYGPTS